MAATRRTTNRAAGGEAVRSAVPAPYGPDNAGTVGAVALDGRGHLAAATSTGGLAGKPPGRVGDSAIIGAGTWADDRTVAVSATGVGEAFILAGFAHRVDWSIRTGVDLDDAMASALDDVSLHNGAAGPSHSHRLDDFAAIFGTRAMARGWRSASDLAVHICALEHGNPWHADGLGYPTSSSGQAVSATPENASSNAPSRSPHSLTTKCSTCSSSAMDCRMHAPRGNTGARRGGIPGSFRRWRRSSCASTSANSATCVTVSSTWFTPQPVVPAYLCVLAMASRAKARAVPPLTTVLVPTWGTSPTLANGLQCLADALPDLFAHLTVEPLVHFELTHEPHSAHGRARWPHRCRNSCQRPARNSRPPGRYQASALR